MMATYFPEFAQEDREAQVMAASLLYTVEPRMSQASTFSGTVQPTHAFSLHYPW